MKKMTAMTKRIVIAMIMAATSICVTSCGSTTGTDTKTEVKETTTTTAVTTTAEPETTTEATTTKEPETTTTTEATTTKEPETTTEVTTTEPVESSEAEEELYTVEEFLTKIVEEDFGQKVELIEYNTVNECLTIWTDLTDQDAYYDVISEELVEKYNSGEKVNINDFETDYSEHYGGSIFYEPKDE